MDHGQQGIWRGKLSEEHRIERIDTEQQHRGHLRGGALSDLQDHPICACLICGRSKREAWLRLPATVLVPAHVRFSDDLTNIAVLSTVRWRRGQDVGILILDPFPKDRLGDTETETGNALTGRRSHNRPIANKGSERP